MTMKSVLRSLVLGLALTLASSGTVVRRGSTGSRHTPIIFVDQRRGPDVFGSSLPVDERPVVGLGNSQSAETSATSIQTSSGDGGGNQTNQGQATALSTHQQETTVNGTNTQVINNQAIIQAFQQANGTNGTVQQSSNNQVNIVSNQLQQNVNGTLVNVQSGREGVVIINAGDLAGAGAPGAASVNSTGDALVSLEQQSGLTNSSQVTNNQGIIQALQQVGGVGTGGEQGSSNQVNVQSSQEQENVNGTLVNVQEGHRGVVIINTNDETGAVVNQTVINDRPIEEETEESARCRYICLRPANREIYCCDDGSNQELGTSNFHAGSCPPQTAGCAEDTIFRKCAYDSQCQESERCCYDDCAFHHVCHPAILE